MKTFRLVALAICCFAGCKDLSNQSLHITDAWTRPYNASAGVTTAVYLTIHNPTLLSAELTGALVEQADTVEIHHTIMENGIMRMRPAATVLIDPGKSLAFQPGGHHLMVKGLRKHLAQGDSLRLSLQIDGEQFDLAAVVRWE